MNDQDIDVQELFARHGLRCTRQRVALFETLSQSKSHPTADQLFHDVRDKIDGVSLATVYNTLDALCHAGLARKIPSVTIASESANSNGSTRYDACTHSHPHLRCLKSGAVHDIPQDLGRQLLESLPQSTLKRIETKLGFRIDQVQIELHGEYLS